MLKVIPSIVTHGEYIGKLFAIGFQGQGKHGVLCAGEVPVEQNVFGDLCFGAAMAISLVGCSGNNGSSNHGGSGDGSTSSYSSAVEVLETVYGVYSEDQKFPIGGGDSEHMTTDAPGAFDVSKTEELTSTLSLPESETTHIDDAASMIHMMNANTFTGAAYHLTGDVSADEFADALKEGILAKQWICGMPDTLVVINVDGQYVIAAYGADDLVETFKDNALSALDGAEAIIDTPVVEG